MRHCSHGQHNLGSVEKSSNGNQDEYSTLFSVSYACTIFLHVQAAQLHMTCKVKQDLEKKGENDPRNTAAHIINFFGKATWHSSWHNQGSRNNNVHLSLLKHSVGSGQFEAFKRRFTAMCFLSL